MFFSISPRNSLRFPSFGRVMLSYCMIRHAQLNHFVICGNGANTSQSVKQLICLFIFPYAYFRGLTKKKKKVGEMNKTQGSSDGKAGLPRWKFTKQWQFTSVCIWVLSFLHLSGKKKFQLYAVVNYSYNSDHFALWAANEWRAEREQSKKQIEAVQSIFRVLQRWSEEDNLETKMKKNESHVLTKNVF